MGDLAWSMTTSLHNFTLDPIIKLRNMGINTGEQNSDLFYLTVAQPG